MAIDFDKGQTEGKSRKTTSGNGGTREKGIEVRVPDEGTVRFIAALIKDTGPDGDKKDDRRYIPFRAFDGWEIPDDIREEFEIPDDVENLSVEEMFHLTFNKGGDTVQYFDSPITRIDNVADVESEEDENGRWQPTEVNGLLEGFEDYPEEELYKSDGGPRKHVTPHQFATTVEDDEVAPSTLRRDLNSVFNAHFYPLMVEELDARVSLGMPQKSDNGWETDSDRCKYIRFKTAKKDDERWVNDALENGLISEDDAEAFWDGDVTAEELFPEVEDE